jgi:hypothetical protein
LKKRRRGTTRGRRKKRENKTSQANIKKRESKAEEEEEKKKKIIIIKNLLGDSEAFVVCVNRRVKKRVAFFNRLFVSCCNTLIPSPPINLQHS